MKRIKENAIVNQKKIIAELRENSSSELSREKAIEKLNLMVDDYENDIDVINKVNISLYYEFMSDENLKNCNQNIFQDIPYDDLYCGCKMISYEYDLFFNRLKEIQKMIEVPSYHFNIKLSRLKNEIDGPLVRIGLTVFDVKDNLKPIDKYITEIKESAVYKSYVANSAKVS